MDAHDAELDLAPRVGDRQRYWRGISGGLLIGAANGPEAFAAVNGIAASWFGQLVMFLWSFALFYHLCNGIRHLVWDVGVGLDPETARLTALSAYGVAAALTIFVWIWAFIA